MTNNFYLYNQLIDLSTNLLISENAKLLYNIIKPLIENIIKEVLNKNFPFESFSFEKRKRNLTKKAGFYLIINKRTSKFYLGSTSNLAQRKGEHKKNLTSPIRNKKLSPTIRSELLEGDFTDFFFVPVLAFYANNVVVNENRNINKFLDEEVENLLLKDFISEDSPYKSYFYNLTTIGTFQNKNKMGGTPQSGALDKPLCFENFTWESVSAAAFSLMVDRKTIRNKCNNDIFKFITTDEFEKSQGIRITNLEAVNFFKNKKQILIDLRNKLKLRKNKIFEEFISNDET